MYKLDSLQQRQLSESVHKVSDDDDFSECHPCLHADWADPATVLPMSAMYSIGRRVQCNKNISRHAAASKDVL